MKNATTQNTGATPASTSVFNKIVAVITALSLVFLQTPISGLSSQAMADATDAAQAQLAENEAVDVPLTFENAYITYADQVIAPPATKVTIPGAAAMEFTATADAGYQLESVKAVINGAETVLAADGNGVYKLTAADVATTSNITVRAITAPTVEEAVVAADAEEAASANDAADANDAAEASEASASAQPAESDEAIDAAETAGEPEIEATAEDGEQLAQGQIETNKLIAELEAEEAAAQAERVRTEYVYADADVTVVATLSQADAVPDDALFQVKRVDAGTAGYNYDVYMQALNESVVDVEYTSDNTLLYDIAFMVPKTDSAGNAIPGELVEYEPEAGTVDITITFNNDQLAGALSAEQASDVEIIHLPLTGSALSAVDTTADATNIYVSDVIVEAVAPSASVESEQVSFTLDSLSITAVSTAGSNNLMATTSSAVTSGAQTSANLADFLQSASISAPQNANGTYAIVPGSSYSIALSFAENSSLQFPNDGTTMYYQLPEGLHVADGDKGSLSIKINDGGTFYTISGNDYYVENGVLYFNFNTSDPNFSRLAASANVKFNMSFDGTFAENAESITFKDGISKDFDVDNSSKVTISKSSAVSTTNNKVNYTVAVRSDGASKNVVVTDTIEGDVLSLKSNSFVITSSTRGKLSVNPTISGNTFKLTIPEMANGELITIGYGATIDPSKIPNVNGKVSTTANNGVSAKSDDQPNPTTVNHSTTIDYTPGIDKDDPTVVSENGDKKTLSWSITANRKQLVSMAGSTITDRISSVATSFMKYSGSGITVNVYDENGNKVRTDNVPWNKLTSYSDSTWTYTVPQSDSGHAYKYVITYTTEADLAGKTSMTRVANEVTTSGGKSDRGEDSYMPAGGEVKVGKTATNIDIENMEITWKVSFNVPEAGLTGTYIKDVIPNKWLNNVLHREGLVPGSVTVDGLIGDETYSVHDHSYDDNLYDSDKSYFKIYFYKSKSHADDNLGLNGGSARTITVTYKTIIDPELYQEGMVGNSWYQFHTNKARLTTNGEEKWSQDDAVALGPTVTKKASYYGTRNVNGVELPVYRYEVVLSNVTDDVNVVDDAYDTSLLEPYIGNSWDAFYIFGGGTYSQDTKGGQFSYVFTSDGMQFTTSEAAMPHDSSSTTGYYDKYKLVYYLTVKNEAALNTIIAHATANDDGTYAISNTAEWNGGSSTADVTYQYQGLKKEILTPDDQLKKTDEDIWAKFRITLNPGAQMLNGGDPLTMTDTVNNLSVDITSIQADPADGVSWDMSGNTVTYTIPDQTKVVITYSARVILTDNGNAGDTVRVNFSNVAEMNGYKGEVNKTAERHNSGSGAGSVPVINLMKYEAGDMTHKLEGAVFDLLDSNGNPVIDKNGKPVSFTTDENGMITVRGDQERLGWALAENTRYYLQESKAPAGYTLADFDYSFQITADGTTDYANYIYHTGDTMSAKDYKGTDVKVSKEWTNGNEKHEADDVTVKLQQKIGDGAWSDTVREEVRNANGDYVWVDTPSKTVVLNDSNDWASTFKNLPIAVPVSLSNTAGEDVAVEYQVVETLVNGEPVAEGTMSVASEMDGGSYKFTITNEAEDETGSLELVKEFGWDYNTLVGGYAGNKLGGNESTGDGIAGTIMKNITFTITGKATGETFTIKGNGYSNYADSPTDVVSASGNTTVKVSYYNKKWTITGLPYDTYEVVETTDGYRDAGNEVDTILHKFYTTGTFDVTKSSTTTNVAVGNTTGAKAGEGVSESGATVTVGEDPATMRVLNIYYRPKVVEVTKTWDIPDGYDYTPGDIQVQLVRSVNGVDNGNGKLYYYPVTAADVPEHPDYATAKTLHWNAATKSYDTVVFSQLPAVTADGEQITYEVREVSADGTLVPLVNGSYTDADGNVLASGNLYVDADGTTATATSKGGATPKKDPYADGITYSSSKRIVLQNKIETTEATVKKVWNDVEDKDGMRPASLVVALSDGTEVTLNDDNDWTAKVENLPKYKNGQEVAYTWSETSLPQGYSLSGSTAVGTVTALTNGYVPEETSATVKKVWDDAENQDGMRPETLTVTLSDGQSVTLSEANNWEATIDGLPKYKDGAEIAYTWTEGELPEGYTLSGTAKAGTVTTLTNKHVPEKTSATVKKVWDDNSNQDGKRPAEITVTLSDGQSVTLNAENGWQQTITGLDKYAAGEEIAYTWTESEEGLPEGYELSNTSVNGTITTITNTHVPETTALTVKKVWEDAENQDGARPNTLVVALKGTDKTVTLSDSNNWQATIDGLPVYKNGQKVAYEWAEVDLPQGYELTNTETAGAVTTLTNTHTPELTEATVKKVWDDAENQDGKRPDKLTVTLSNGTEVTLNEANNWEATVTGLPKYENGQKIEYAWTEGELPEGYTLTSTKAEGTVTTLTNSYDTEETEATVKKVWDDAENQDGMRPTEIAVTLSNGTEVTLDEANNWEATVAGLPKYENGKEIEYTWAEGKLLEGYELSNTSVNGTITTLTNKHVPEKTSATVKKVWDDAENQDGKRPETLTVTLSDGQSVTLSEANNWEATIDGLPKYKDGAEIAYTWTEGELPEGYTLSGTAKAGTVTTLTNKHVPEKTSATVKKVWDDNSNQDGKRPAEITVTLSDGQSVTLNAENGWQQTITGLDKYAAGEEIAYTWTESEEGLPAGYTLESNAAEGTVTTITNAYTPEETEATVQKVWDDANDQDGKRPASLTVTLSNGQTVTLDEGNGWKATITGLPKYAAGEEIVYTWTEGEMPEGYTLSGTSQDGTVMTLTNTYDTEKTEATVKKVWDDAENQDGKRPAEITVTLSDGQSVTLNAENGWQQTITGLDKYAAGEEIAYTWTESEEGLPEGYTLTSSNKVGTVTTIMNSYVPETTEATVKKAWNDAENQDGKRPTSIDVTFSGDNKTYTLSADNNWTVTVGNLPKYAAGEEIAYTWTESEEGLPAGYTLESNAAEGTVTTITNAYTPEETEATVQKVWDDANDQDGKRPASLTVTLSNGQTVTLDEGNGWKATITGLPKYAAGEEIVYTWTEGELPAGYALTGTAKSGTVTTLTNSYQPQTTSVSIRKVWNDNGNQDGLRPPTLPVTLSNGQTVTLSEANNWTAEITGLPMYAAGELISYAWNETSMPAGYALSGTAIEGLITSVSNAHTPETTEATVTKIWNDANDQDGIRPTSLTVTLSDGQSVTLDEGNEWTATITGLPKYENGQEIEYTWTEGALPAGYTLSGTSKQGTVTTITNTHVPETTEATVTKVWADNENQDGKRPETLTVTLSNGQSVTLNEENGWTATIEGLPKYAAGEEIEYTWTESEAGLPEGYTLTNTAKEGLVTTLTNSYTPENVDVTVRKVWDDADNQDGMRPASLAVTLSNGKTVTLSAGNNWEATIEGLPKYAAGEEIEYTWTEGELPEGYELTNTEVAGEGLVTTLTNTHTPELTEATVKKVWADSENQDGKRPTSLTVTLSNGAKVTLTEDNGWQATVGELPKYKNGKEIEYTWTEDALPSGYTLTNTAKAGTVTTLTNAHTPETVDVTVRKVWDDADNQDGMRPTSLTVSLSNGQGVTLNASNNWTDTITGLPKYAAGEEIEYTWTEGELPEGYELTNTEVAGEGLVTTLTNTHTPELTEATVKKVWADSENQDGKRPTSLTVTLSNGAKVTLTEDNGWQATVGELPKYKNGKEIEYTWTEDALPSGYTLTNTAKAGTITTLTNSYDTEKTSATVEKVWDDADNQDGMRPTSLTVRLSNGDEVVLDAANNWKATVGNLPAYSNGQLIDYTWSEVDLPEGYHLSNTAVNGTITTLTNKHVPEKTSATVKKVWDDAENQDGKRPTALSVELSNGSRVTLNSANNWEATIDGLPKYKDGAEIAYTWSEVDLPDTYSLTNTEVSGEGLVTTLTNTHAPEKTSATVKKVWDDVNDQDGIRPSELTVTLSDGQSVTLDEANNWTATIEGLPKYENGKEIEYTWTEGELPSGYTLTNTAKEGLVTTLTNTHVPEKTSATVKKAWDDADNQDGKRPAEITVTLSNDQSVTLSEANNWTATIDGLPKYAAGKEIVYTWAEGEMPEGYALTDTSRNGVVTTLTNSYSPEETSATVRKVWDDAENQDGKRPAELTVALSDGTEVTLNAANGWQETVTGLPKYADGKEIAYTWTESAEGLPQGYSLTGSTKDGTVTTLTNSYTPEVTKATVKKVWDDASDQDGKRPETLTVALSNGQSVTLNEENGWTATVENLPKYANGKEIEYTWTEGAMPEGYTLSDMSKNGIVTTLTNSYTPEVTKATVKKVWDDASDQDGKRPETLTVALSNGQSVTLSEANNWTATIEGLPKYAAGEEIAYTWTESAMPEGYTLTSTAKEGLVTTLTNSYTPELVDVTVKKVWDDANNQDGKRPVNLNVVLSNGMQVTLDAANEWTQTIRDLPKYAAGEEIVYSWTEIGLPEAYTLTGTATDGIVTTLTNSYDTEETTATVKKVWNDNEDQDGIRPTSLTVTLSNGTAVELNAANGWEATVEHLPVYSDGVPITYTWTEGELPEGYKLTDVSVNGTVTTLTNTHTPEKTSATVRKVWDDAENQDGKRPTSLTVALSNGDRVTLNEANEWTQTIQDLPKYAAGKEITYSWTEVDLPVGYTLSNTEKDGLVTTLTNTHAPEKTSATVKKVWDDANDQDGIQPESLTVALSNGAEVTLDADNGWEATVEDLPKYANGKEIAYTWTEVDLPSGYALSDTSVSGTVTTLTNTHTPDVTSATVRKVWDDAENQDGIRPASLTVALSNGAEVELNAANGWTATIGNLPKYAAGEPIVYTWTESEAGLPEGYTLSNAEIEGLVTTLTNSYSPEETSATVTKVWNDNEDQDGIRPASLTVALSNGDEVELNAANGWTATVTGLPKYANGGQPITYTWTEGEMPAGYTLTDTSVNGTVTTLTNTHVPEQTSATVKKVWDDANDQDGIQPESLTVALSNGTEVTLNADNNWTATIEGLPKNANGKEIVYSWTEIGLPEGYALSGTSKDGIVTTLTNTHVPETTAVTVGKTWSDNENQDGMRPTSITVHLFADGAEVDSAVIEADASGAWSHRFADLPVYRNGGTPIVYTTTEDVVSGYATEISGFGVVNSLRTGDLVVTKAVENTTAPTRFAFTVTLDDERVSGQHGDMTFVDGVATFELAGGERAIASKLPAGVGYTVTEEPVVGYEATSTGATGTIVAGDVSTAAFTNVYNASASAEFVAMKALDGRTLGPAEFSFALSEKDAETGELSFVGDAVNNGAGEVRFGAIRYTLDDLGLHDYVLTETAGSLLGVTYDSHAHEFSVDVTDNGDGTLGLAFDGVEQMPESGTYSINTGATFGNKYAPSGSVELEATKVLEGATLEAGAYTFEVTTGVGDDRRVIATATNDADGNVKFPALTFSAAGTYKYTISEVVPANAQTLGELLVANGVAYDTHAVDVTIVTTDDFHGNLNCAVSYDGVAVEEGGAATFENSKVPDTEYPLVATKHMQGREFNAGDAFTFTVTADEGAPLPENTSMTIAPASGTEAPIDFGNIVFTTDDLGKTYTYTIAEERSGETVGGLQYDPFAHWVKLTVVDAGDGTMGVRATYQNDGDGIVFTNTYTAEAEAVLTATKMLEGRDLADGEFFFELSGGNLEAPLHASAAADGTVAFAPLKFTQDDAGKDFTYTISETRGTLGGVTYDESTYDVTLHVTDAGDGTMSVSYDWGEAGAAPVFRNTYRTEPTSVALEAHKMLVGGTLTGGEFSFTLTGVSENAAGTAQTATNDADGLVSFDAIDYDAAGVYEYTIAEVVPADATDNGDGTFTSADGIVYDGAEHTATVTVTDNGYGKLVAEVAYDEPAGISFGNTALARTGFEFDKYYFGGVGTFDFTLTATDSEGVARAGSPVDYSDAESIVDDGATAFTATVQNGAFAGNAAKVVFPEIAYAADGEYYYLVVEDEPSSADMIADRAQYLVHVTVADGVAAEPVYELIYDGVNYGATTDRSFYNNSAVTLGFDSLSTQSYTDMGQRVSVYPEAKKYLNGSTDQLVGDDFTFELIDQATGQTIAMGTNDEAGNVAFFDEDTDPGLVYDEPGEYYYLMREVAGDEAGMTYDDSTILMTVSVTQTDEGLAADVTYNGPGGAEPAFYNTREGMDVEVYKVSRFGGEGLDDCTYALWMAGENGDVLLQEATSDETGRIIFKDVALIAGQKYFFKEVEAPKGHTVDPYRTAYFSLNETGDALVLVEDTASDGWHSANENIELDKANGEEN